jgi:hypothetical protein
MPASVADLTPEWFSNVLSAAITAVELEPLDEGVGFLGRTVRARLSSDEPADPPHVVIVKFAADGPARIVAASMGLYEREVRFYRDVAPRVGIRVPDCSLAEIDLDSGLFVLMLADLAPARAGDQLVGATDDEIAAAVSTAAQLHAAWWDNPAMAGYTWLPSQAALVAATLDKAPELYPAFAEAWSGELSDDELALGEKVTFRLGPLVDALDHPPFTLVHGDYRLDNLFFTANGGVAVIDWQLSFRGHSGFRPRAPVRIEPHLRRSGPPDPLAGTAVLGRVGAKRCRRIRQGRPADDPCRSRWPTPCPMPHCAPDPICERAGGDDEGAAVPRLLGHCTARRPRRASVAAVATSARVRADE